MPLNLHEAQKVLRHRYPMRLIDKVLELRPGQFIKAVKNVTINEEFFQGHFPGYPIMPGVLIVEAMAQAAGVLAMNTVADIDEQAYCLLTSIDKAKFKRPVVPGDTLTIEAYYKQKKMNFCSLETRAYVESNKVASAVLHFVQTKPNPTNTSANR